MTSESALPAAHPAGHAQGAGEAHGGASRMGMWLFLFTEAFLFGTLFLIYAVYLRLYLLDFRAGSALLALPIGAVNTVILLTSSLTVALAIASLERSRKTLCLAMLALTILLALAFLGIKGYEWSSKFHHGIYPGSPHLAEQPRGEILFFGLYFVMTGLHGLHVLIGAAVLALTLAWVSGDRIRRDRPAFLENAGLYWHLVDVIWIYLFPLFYLIRQGK